jgi:hypothetical protein
MLAVRSFPILNFVLFFIFPVVKPKFWINKLTSAMTGLLQIPSGLHLLIRRSFPDSLILRYVLFSYGWCPEPSSHPYGVAVFAHNEYFGHHHQSQ